MTVPLLSTFWVSCLFLVLGSSSSNGYSSDEDPCFFFATLTDWWRDPQAEAAPVNCDQKEEGWYTIMLGEDPALIPTDCMQDNCCGSRVPMHIDLEGQDLPEDGQTINASLCGSFNVLNTIECCVFRQPIRIKRCADPSVYIYYLKPQQFCPATVCATRVKEGRPPRQYRFQAGDIPRSFLEKSTTITVPVTKALEETSPMLSSTELAPTDLVTSNANGTALTDLPQNDTFGESFTTPLLLDNQTSIPDRNTTFLDTITSIPDTNTTFLDTITSIPDTNTTFLDTNSSIPDTNTTFLDTSTFIPDTNTSIPDTNTSIPDTNSSIPDSSTTSPEGNSSIPAVDSRLSDNATTSRTTQNTVSTTVRPVSCVGTSTEMISSPTAAPSSSDNSSITLSFLVRGTLERSGFQNTIKTFVTTLAGFFCISTETIPFVHSDHIQDNISVINIDFNNSVLGQAAPVDKLIAGLNNSSFTELLHQKTGLHVLDVCPAEDRCDLHVRGQFKAQSVSEGVENESSCEQYMPILVALVVFLALVVLIFALARLYKHCSRQGTWVPPPEKERCPEKAVESSTVAVAPAEKANGDHPLAHNVNVNDTSPSDKQSPVQPSAQQPADANKVATKTEDTSM